MHRVAQQALDVASWTTQLKDFDVERFEFERAGEKRLGLAPIGVCDRRQLVRFAEHRVARPVGVRVVTNEQVAAVAERRSVLVARVQGVLRAAARLHRHHERHTRRVRQAEQVGPRVRHVRVRARPGLVRVAAEYEVVRQALYQRERACASVALGVERRGAEAVATRAIEQRELARGELTQPHQLVLETRRVEYARVDLTRSEKGVLAVNATLQRGVIKKNCKFFISFFFVISENKS